MILNRFLCDFTLKNSSKNLSFYRGFLIQKFQRFKNLAKLKKGTKDIFATL